MHRWTLLRFPSPSPTGSSTTGATAPIWRPRRRSIRGCCACTSIVCSSCPSSPCKGPDDCQITGCGAAAEPGCRWQCSYLGTERKPALGGQSCRRPTGGAWRRRVCAGAASRRLPAGDVRLKLVVQSTRKDPETGKERAQLGLPVARQPPGLADGAGQRHQRLGRCLRSPGHRAGGGEGQLQHPSGGAAEWRCASRSRCDWTTC